MSTGVRPQSARAIANHFVSLLKGDGDATTPMKLLKLVYIAHGWNLAVFDAPLIDDRIEAWEYGPVIPDLYHAIKKFGLKEVVGPIKGGSRAILKDYDADHLRLAELVLSTYRGWDAIELSAMTHREGTPWHTVWNDRGRQGRRNMEIPNHLLREHFLELGSRVTDRNESRAV